MWRTELDGPTHHEALLWRDCAVVRTEKTVYALSTQDGSVYHQWHWPNNSLWSLEMRGDQLFLVMRQAEIPGQPIHPQAEFVGLIDDTEVYRSTYPPHITPNLKYESRNGLLYEAARQGLGIVDPGSGHRLFAVYDFQRYGRYDLHADYTSLPTIIDNTMFLLNELGTIYALKHPQ